jgi:hypothetical protein
MTPLVQALLCLAAAAGFYALSGHLAGEAHDGVIALAGITASLWMRLPQGGKPVDGGQ